jgi:hypothetical protein
MLYGYQFKEKYKVLKKPADRIGLDLSNPMEPKLVHLRRIESKSSSSTTTTPKGDTRVQRVLGKRTAHIVEALQASLNEATWESVCALHFIDANEHLLRLIAQFGGQSSHNYRSGSNTVWDLLMEDIMSEFTESLWSNVKAVLSQRLSYNKLDDTLTESYSIELGKTAELIGFDLDAANSNAATTPSSRVSTNATSLKGPTHDSPPRGALPAVRTVSTAKPAGMRSTSKAACVSPSRPRPSSTTTSRSLRRT